MDDKKVIDFTQKILENIPTDWLNLTTHRLDIYDEKLAKNQFLEEFEKLLEDDPTSLDGGITADKSFSGITTVNFTEKTTMQQVFTTIFAMSKGSL